jgi:hypothetical protein
VTSENQSIGDAKCCENISILRSSAPAMPIRYEGRPNRLKTGSIPRPFRSAWGKRRDVPSSEPGIRSTFANRAGGARVDADASKLDLVAWLLNTTSIGVSPSHTAGCQASTSAPRPGSGFAARATRDRVAQVSGRPVVSADMGMWSRVTRLTLKLPWGASPRGRV